MLGRAARGTSGAGSSDYERSLSKPESKALSPSDLHAQSAGKEAAEKAGRTPLTFHALTPDGNECFHDAITAAEVA